MINKEQLKVAAKGLVSDTKGKIAVAIFVIGFISLLVVSKCRG